MKPVGLVEKLAAAIKQCLSKSGTRCNRTLAFLHESHDRDLFLLFRIGICERHAVCFGANKSR